jgi:ABC-2 type transport system ATP-binding protein
LDGAITWLEQRVDVHDLRVDGDVVRLALDGNRQHQAALLRDLVAAGIEISDFGGHTRSLEEVFLHVTRGAVQ